MKILRTGFLVHKCAAAVVDGVMDCDPVYMWLHTLHMANLHISHCWMRVHLLTWPDECVYNARVYTFSVCATRAYILQSTQEFV